MAKFLLHSAFLILAVVLVFFWTSFPELSVYTLQLIALFVLAYFINQFYFQRKKLLFSRTNLTIDAVIFTLVILLLVASTGGLSSPLFFLVYFLMFGLALLFEPLITFSLSLAMVLFFLLQPTKEAPLAEALQLLSLLLVTPLAMYFGRQYLQVLKNEEKIKILKEETQIIEGEIAKEETDMLLWSSLELKRGLTEILHQSSELLADLSHLTLRQKEKISKIRQTASTLLKTGQKLKEEVDQTSDEN
ncbi:MAG: energy-coupling factor transporter transmembrane protein EcfT [Candidatus Marinimicrobia bacterium]|nr:energy-coupling factor transporter transmembrane protein EcfT [Candidatus Neomarinimicrobiota bacterium]